MSAGKIRIHRLPEGEQTEAEAVSWNGTLLEIELPATAAAPEIAAGVLAQVDAADTVFLGEIKLRQGTRLIVAVEHTIDRQALAGIQELWKHRSERRP